MLRDAWLSRPRAPRPVAGSSISQAEPRGNGGQPPVESPQPRAVECSRAEKVGIDPTQTASDELVLRYEAQDFLVLGLHGLGEVFHPSESVRGAAQAAPP